MRIAIDGTSASGKGTIAKELSKILNIPSLDTGKLYRAVALCDLNENKNHDLEKTIEIASNIKKLDLNNSELNREDIGNLASKLAAIKDVRKRLLSFQLEFARRKGGAIMEGRDIGTVIMPEADFKFFIDADVNIRAERRFNQLIAFGYRNINYDDILNKLMERDKQDRTRTLSPLVIPDDAVVMDTSKIPVIDVVNGILEIINFNAQ